MIAASPAMAPVAMPSALGLPRLVHSMHIHVNPAVADAIWVTTIAIPATPSAASWLPAVNPNQLTQSIAAPTTVNTRLLGGMGVEG